MEYKRTGARLVIPDRPTVREQLEYYSTSSAISQKDKLARMWAGAITLMTEWESEVIPDRFVSLDELSDPSVTEIVTWAGLLVFRHMNALEDLPKNS